MKELRILIAQVDIRLERVIARVDIQLEVRPPSIRYVPLQCIPFHRTPEPISQSSCTVHIHILLGGSEFSATGGSEFTGVPPPSTIARRDSNQMTWGLRFLVKWVHNVLGFRTCGSQRGLKVFLSQKPSRKVRAVEVPFEGSKRENSSGAPKWAIHVKSLLNDLLKLLRGTFHLLGSSTLSDLKVPQNTRSS